MPLRYFGHGRRFLRAGTAVRRRRRTRGRSLLCCVRMSMMPAELAWRTCSHARYSPECVEEGAFCEVELPLYGVLRKSALRIALLLLNHRFGRSRAGYGVRMPMHYLPGPLFRAIDHRNPKSERGNVPPSAKLGLLVL